MTVPQNAVETAPDFALICWVEGVLSVHAYRRTRRADVLLWREEVPSTGSEAWGEAIRPVLAKHRMRQGTPVAVCAPPGVGGFVAVPTTAQNSVDRQGVEQLLASSLPFPPAELRWRALCAAGGIEVFWLPDKWLAACQDSFRGVGMQLAEAYPRGALLRGAIGRSANDALAVETDAVHVFSRGLLVRSTPLPESAEERERALALERLALAGAANPETVDCSSRAAEERGKELLRLWQSGDEAIVVQTDTNSLWAPVVKAAIGWCIAAAVLAGGLLVLNSMLAEHLDIANREYRKLAPQAVRYADMERLAHTNRQLSNAVKTMDDSPLPLETLTAVTTALPDGYWLRKMVFKEGVLELIGQGGDSDETIALLAKQGITATRVNQEKTAGSFAVRIEPPAIKAGAPK